MHENLGKSEESKQMPVEDPNTMTVKIVQINIGVTEERIRGRDLIHPGHLQAPVIS